MNLRRPGFAATSGTTTRLVFWLGLAIVGVFACWVRIRGLPSLFFSMDVSHPIAKALDILQGGSLPWRGEAVCFHFGALQTWFLVPILAISGRLRDAVVLNAVIHALGVLPMALAGRRLGGWTTGIVAAVFYACWPVLVLHPCEGAWTYQAPVFLALASMACARALTGGTRADVLAMSAAMACAVHFHPFALAPIVGVVVVAPRLVKIHDWKTLAAATALFVAILVPMIVDNAQTIFGERTNEGCSLIQATTGSTWQLVARSVLRVGLGWPRWAEIAVLLALPFGAVWLAVRRRPLEAGGLIVMWALAQFLAISVMAKVLEYMEPYHAAVLVPCLALALSWLVVGLPEAMFPRQGAWRAAAAFWTLPLLAFGAVRASDRAHDEGRPDPGQLEVIDRVDTAICQHAGANPVSIVLLADSNVVSMGEIVIFNADLWLRGAMPPEPADRAAPARPTYAVVTLREETWQDWGEGDSPESLLRLDTRGETVLEVLAFSDAATALSWLRRGCSLVEQWPGLDVSDLSKSLGGLAASEDFFDDPSLSQMEILCRAR